MIIESESDDDADQLASTLNDEKEMKEMISTEMTSRSMSIMMRKMLRVSMATSLSMNMKNWLAKNLFTPTNATPDHPVQRMKMLLELP